VTERTYKAEGWTITFPWSGVKQSDLSPHVPAGARVFLEWNWGRWMRPVLKPQYWFLDQFNPWFQRDPAKVWFTIDVGFAGPFFGWEWDGDGKYIGFKRFPLAHEEYKAWTDAPIAAENSAITFSVRG
jgi:hypothetical protein